MTVLHKKMLSLAFIATLFVFVLAPVHVFAADTNTDALTVNSFTNFSTGTAKTDPRDVIKSIINVVMGFLGMIAVIMILAAGFMWMTAGGNEENSKKAQKLLVNAIIGLVIIFSAWTVAYFAVSSIKTTVTQ